VLGILTAAAFAAAVGSAAPAQAALSGNDWTEQTLPANYSIGGGAPLSPVSCVPGTRFCVVIADDSANIVNGFFIGQAALVTTDAGQTWTGYATLPSTFQVTAVSCASASICWASGITWQDSPAVAESTDGGQTWTDKTPTAWAAATWWPKAIDCVSATTCWLAGVNNAGNLENPAVIETTDGGANWTTLSNLPTFVSHDPNGTYELDGISCLSAVSCVAVGGLNDGSGTATVISTTDGGATWTRSDDPTLSRIEELFSVSCLPAAHARTTCFAAGTAQQAAGPVAVLSRDGGVTWGDRQQFDNTGWLNSISCATTENCWAAGSGTTVSLVGTADAGKSWASVTSDTSNQDGSVSCLSVNVCVATTDNGLWVTSDDGGLPTAG
jgi:photosystem II stability/assembly factor-like uncharacterized protein